MSEQYVKPEQVGSVLGGYLREPDEPDRVLPKNKKVEIVFLIEAVNELLLRTEGAEDINLLKIPGTMYEVPVILPQKLQAVSRRRMLAYLRAYRDSKSQELGDYLKKLAVVATGFRGGKEVEIGFVKARAFAEKPSNWDCYVQPPSGDSTTDAGMDGFCPACALHGTVLTSDHIMFKAKDKEKNVFAESVGIKSRVEFDPAFAILDQGRSVVERTHNKVADGVSWTGQSLYTEYHVVPGTIFVGKVTLEDVTENELKAFLANLATITRLGGRERIYGGVRVHLAGIRGGRYETVSALEITRKLADKYNNIEKMPTVEEVLNDVVKILKDYGFNIIKSDDYSELAENMDTWSNLWRDTVEFDRQIIKRIMVLGDKYSLKEE